MVICRVYAKTQGHFHDCFEVILENLTKGGVEGFGLGMILIPNSYLQPSCQIID